jgi:hypothetical protein
MGWVPGARRLRHVLSAGGPALKEARVLYYKIWNVETLGLIFVAPPLVNSIFGEKLWGKKFKLGFRGATHNSPPPPIKNCLKGAALETKPRARDYLNPSLTNDFWFVVWPLQNCAQLGLVCLVFFDVTARYPSSHSNWNQIILECNIKIKVAAKI